eukprot:gene10962-22905_t
MQGNSCIQPSFCFPLITVIYLIWILVVRDSTTNLPKLLSKDLETLNVNNSKCLQALKLIHEIHYGCVNIGPIVKVLNVTYTIGSPTLNTIQREYESQQLSFLRDLVANPNLNTSGSVIFGLHDGTNLSSDIERSIFLSGVPLLTHSHNGTDDNYTIYQPDFVFIKYRGFARLIASFDNYNLRSYKMRIPKVFWRGTTTGSSGGGGCLSLPRTRMCLLAKNSTWMDVKIKNSVQLCEGHESTLRNLGIVGRRLREFGWAQFRGVMDIPGNTNAWGLFWRLASGSVVFRVEGDFTNAYIKALRPWTHYVPIAANLSDLLVATRRVQQDDNLGRIADNARRFVRGFTYEREVDRVARELSSVWSSSSSSQT